MSATPIMIFSGTLPWMGDAVCKGQSDLFFPSPGERPEARAKRETKAQTIFEQCPVLGKCKGEARKNREYGFWGGESEENRAEAGFRVDMPVGRLARFPKAGSQAADERQKSSLTNPTGRSSRQTVKR